MSAEQDSSSPHLLYSEYINTNNAKHVMQLIESKNKEKPVMKFTKSSVLSKVMNLLPRLEQGEAELKTKDESELNIEVCDENCPAIEMNVAIPKGLQDNEPDVFSENSNEANSEIMSNKEDSEESSEENASSEESDEEDILPLGKPRTLQQIKENTLQNEKLIIHNSTSNMSNGQFNSRAKGFKSASLDLIDVDKMSYEPPAKKLCQLLD